MFSRVISAARDLPSLIYGHLTKWPRVMRVGVVTLFVLFVGLSIVFDGSTTDDDFLNTTRTVPQVTVATLGALQANGTPTLLLGEIRSVSQADLRAQKSGEITTVNVRTGQMVTAGTVLATIENAPERAGVLQAQGALQAAEAQLLRVQNGARSEDRASATAGAVGAEVSLAQAREQAQSAYTSAYAAAQDAVLAKADVFFTNPYTVDPSFRVTSASYDERQVLEAERIALGNILDTWKARAATPVSPRELTESLDTAQANLDRIKRFIDRVAYFVSTQAVTSDRSSTDIAAQNVGISSAQQHLVGARSSVSGARTALAAATTASTVATLSESKLAVGERPEDLQTAQAMMVQARGVLASATASLEHTLIRTPISGTVTSLSVARGDFVMGQQQVAMVAQEGAHEIVVFVSDDVRTTLMPGMKVLVEGRYEGVITALDPGLDPETKRARVTIGIPQDVDVANGAFVEVSIHIDTASSQSAATTPRTGWFIPIEAIKVLPTGLAIFSISEAGTLLATPISEGTIVADRMRIDDNLSPDLRIVTDVRGRVEGEKVTTN